VERFINDPLNEFGYGLHTIYTQSGFQYRGYDSYDETLSIYNEWHQKLNECVKFQFHYIDRTVIVDAHSFSEKQLKDKVETIPDICIGSNTDTSRVLVNLTVDHFNKLGYKVLENIPYSGAISSSGAESIMIEVNKKLYLDENYRKKSDFIRLKDDIEEVLNHINDYEFDGK
jgi:N-formylglutamate amidohydrolase